jgi:hypothetical protein
MNIDPKKLLLIDEFKNMAQGKNPDEILPLLLAISQKSHKMGLTFTKEESLYLIDQLKESLPEHERSRIDMLVKMMF